MVRVTARNIYLHHLAPQSAGHRRRLGPACPRFDTLAKPFETSECDVVRTATLSLLALASILSVACAGVGGSPDSGATDASTTVDGAADADAADADHPDAGELPGLYVALDGDDSNAGTIDDPLATLEAARDRLRSGDRSEPTVYLRAGTYARAEAFLLSEEDGGTEEQPVRYRAYPGETVVLSGGVDVPLTMVSTPSPEVLERLPDTSRDRVRALDLAAAGAPIERLGRIRYWQFGGFGYDDAPGVLVFDDERMQYARYPKAGAGPAGDGFMRTGAVIHPGSVPRHGIDRDPPGGRFEYNDAAIDAWSAEWAQDGNLWMYGYWEETYADGTLQVGELDTSADTVEAVQASWYGIGEDERYYFFNAIDALELPGEFVIDESAQMVYFIPPDEARSDSRLQISLLNEPLVLVQGASHVHFDGIDFQLTRQEAVRVEDASHVRVSDFAMRHLEGVAVRMPEEGAYGNVIENGTMEGLGSACFVIGGGDPRTQAAGESRVENVSCERFGLVDGGRSMLTGVGNRVSHCAFRQSKGDALAFRGQELVVEYSIFTDLDLTANDAGAVYSGRDPTDAGNEVRFNYFARIGNELEGTGVQGVYIDDRSGFLRVYGNLFFDVGSGVHAAAFKVNGGKHNVFENNIVVGRRAVYIQIQPDASWAAWYGEPITIEKLERVGYGDPESEWARRYPVANAMVGRTPQEPRDSNVLRHNIVLGDEMVWGIVEGRYGYPEPLEEGNWLIDEDPGFADLAAGDLSLDRSTIEARFPGFEWIDADAIGPR